MNLKKINIFYFIVLLLFASVGAMAQKWNLMYGLIITEVGLVLIPSLIFLFMNNMKPAEFMRFKRMRLSLVPYVVGITVSGWFVAEFIGILSVFCLSKFIHIPTQALPPPTNGTELALELVIVAGLAAVCEEIMMRGVILRGYEAKGEAFGIIMSGLLFALLHLNPTNFFSIWFLGMMLAYLVYRTDSIFAGMIAHFTNNSIALVIMYMVGIMSGGSAPTEAGQAVITPDVLLAWSVIVIPFIVLFVFLLRGFKRKTQDIQVPKKPDYVATGGIIDYWPVAVTAVIYIVRMVMMS